MNSWLILLLSGGSVLIGGIASLLFFKRKYTYYRYVWSLTAREHRFNDDFIMFSGRKWPVIAGAGFGVGYAYSNCEHELNKSFILKSVQWSFSCVLKEICIEHFVKSSTTYLWNDYLYYNYDYNTWYEKL